MQNAPNPEAATERSAELVEAAREASSLTNQLLSFERASGMDVDRSGMEIDLRNLLKQIAMRFGNQVAPKQMNMNLTLCDEDVAINGDEIMLKEAILNLLTDAVIHGAPEMSTMAISLVKEEGNAAILVKDNGVGIPRDKFVEAISRFGQASGGPGSGLGLPIAARVMKNHGGTLRLLDTSGGAAVLLKLPVIDRETSPDGRHRRD